MQVQHVLQKHARGCAPACLAMITGHDYDAICARCPEDWNEHGLYLVDLDGYLAEHGYAVARRLRFEGFRHTRRERAVWPCRTFADVHLCEVEVSAGAPCYHFVVMLRSGVVLDPLTTEPRQLSDYHQILNIAGVYPVGERFRCA